GTSNPRSQNVVPNMEVAWVSIAGWWNGRSPGCTTLANCGCGQILMEPFIRPWWLWVSPSFVWDSCDSLIFSCGSKAVFLQGVVRRPVLEVFHHVPDDGDRGKVVVA